MPYQDFMPNFKKQEEIFKKEKTEFGKPWPYQKPTEQRRYENWKAEVVNPTDDEFYTIDSGQNDGSRKGPQHIVRTIVRIRRKTGAEFLYSYGQIIGYTSLGMEQTTPCDKPEIWTMTKFGKKQMMDPKHPTHVIVATDGPRGSETIYELPFTAANLKELYDKRENDYIAFSVMDEMSGKNVEVKQQTEATRTYELFRDSTFDYLFYANYISSEQKEEFRRVAEKEGLTNVQLSQQGARQQESRGRK